MGRKIFDKVQFSRPRKSAFDLSRDVKLSCKMGQLIPIYLEEIVPTDQFKVKTEILIRMAPMIAPIMHKVDIYTHFFFVPNRIIWSQWEEFITGGKLGTSVIAMPTVDIRGENEACVEGTVTDFFGLPTITSSQTVDGTPYLVSALPFRGYAAIWNEYYRDQNLTTEIDYTHATWSDPTEQVSFPKILNRAWEKDYFTSCLPWAQRGAAVTLPLDATFTPQYITPASIVPSGTADGVVSVVSLALATPTDPVEVQNLVDPQVIDNNSVTIEDLRQSSRLQEFFEKAAVAGSRYIEQLAAYFGADPGDARLQRPEFLGGGRQPITVSEVLNTTGPLDSTNDEGVAQGQMSGHGISVGGKNGFKKTFQEHGYVIGIMSILPRTSYQQGVPKTFLRATRFDFYFPEFANTGEQAITLAELFIAMTFSSDRTNTFGYQQRYAEYKYARSTVHAEMKSSLDYWHLGRIFSAAPFLNEAFVTSDPDDRIFAVQDAGTDDLYVHIFHQVHARRPMPFFANPKL